MPKLTVEQREKYRAKLTRLGLTEEQASAHVSALERLFASLIDRAFKVDPVSLAVAEREDDPRMEAESGDALPRRRKKRKNS